MRPDQTSRLPPQAGFRYLGLHGLSALSAPSGFTVRRLAIARGDQFLLKLQPFVGCHGGFFALGRQIFYRERMKPKSRATGALSRPPAGSAGGAMRQP